MDFLKSFSASSRWVSWYTGLFCVYAVALTTSTAGMELLAALLTLTAVIVFVLARIRSGGFKAIDLRFPGDLFLWVFIGFILLGAVLIPDLSTAERGEIVRGSRFILTLYALILGLLVLAGASRAAAPTAGSRLSLVLKVLFVAAGLVAIYGFIQFFTGWDILRSAPYEMTIFGGESPRLFRVKGFYTNTMSYSYIFGMLFCLMFAAGYFRLVKFTSSPAASVILPSACLLVGITLFMTFTRGLWIAVIAAIFVMTFLIRKRWAVQIAAAVVVVLVGLSSVSEPFRERLAGVVRLDQSNSARILIWQNHWAMFKDHPLLGVGFDQNSRLMQEYNHKLYGKDWRVVHAHNHFLQTLTGVGVFGFLAFLAFSWAMVALAWKLWRQGVLTNEPAAQGIGLASLGAQIVFHVGGLSEAVFFDRESSHMYLFILALTIVTWKLMPVVGKRLEK